MFIKPLSCSGVWFFESVTSTMDVARELYPRLKESEFSVVLARHQTAGRGRLGRRWLSADGAFLSTYLFRLSASGQSKTTTAPGYQFLEGYSLVVGLALHRFFEKRGVPVALKWPNDLLAPDGRKVAGILIEVVPVQSEFAVLCGIGCNLIAAPAPLPSSASIEDLGKRISCEEMLAEFTPELVSLTEQFLRDGFAPFQQDWIARAFQYREGVTIRSGAQIFTGAWEGVNERGELQIRVPDGSLRTISSGEIG